MMVKAHVSPGLREKTKPHVAQLQAETTRKTAAPSPQRWQRLRSPRRSAVLINFVCEGVMTGNRSARPSSQRPEPRSGVSLAHPARQIRNQHSYHVTNVNEDGTVPVVETPHFTIPDLNNFRLNALMPEANDGRRSATCSCHRRRSCE
jgi:hypothetical protein